MFEICYQNQNKIDKIKVLGNGRFAECSLVKRGEKILVMKKPRKKGLESSFSNEINLHKLFDHPNIVPFYDSFIKRGKSHILLYPCIHGSFSDLLLTNTFRKQNKKKMVRQVMKGLESLLRMNVLHRDRKQHNLLVDERMNIRIGDFGFIFPTHSTKNETQNRDQR